MSYSTISVSKELRKEFIKLKLDQDIDTNEAMLKLLIEFFKGEAKEINMPYQ